MAANYQMKIFTLSGFNIESEKNDIVKIISQLGGKYMETPFYLPECDYVICKRPSRGEKYLCSCAEEKPLLIPKYINDCGKAGRWLDTARYDWSNQDWKDGLDKRLLELPKVCHGHKVNHGTRIFGRWKVLLHVQPDQKYKAYKRLLSAGGAKIIQLKPPFTREVKNLITHAFVTKELAKDLKVLKKEKFQKVLYPEYIAEYLVQPTHPPLQKFQHFPAPTKPRTPQQSPRRPILSKHQMRNQRTITEMCSQYHSKRKHSGNGSTETPGKRLCYSPSTPYMFATPTKSLNSSLAFIKDEKTSPSPSSRCKKDSPLSRKHGGIIDAVKKNLSGNLLSEKKQIAPSSKQIEVITIESDDEEDTSNVSLLAPTSNMSSALSKILSATNNKQTATLHTDEPITSTIIGTATSTKREVGANNPTNMENRAQISSNLNSSKKEAPRVALDINTIQKSNARKNISNFIDLMTDNKTKNHANVYIESKKDPSTSTPLGNNRKQRNNSIVDLITPISNVSLTKNKICQNIDLVTPDYTNKNSSVIDITPISAARASIHIGDGDDDGDDDDVLPKFTLSTATGDIVNNEKVEKDDELSAKLPSNKISENNNINKKQLTAENSKEYDEKPVGVEPSPETGSSFTLLLPCVDDVFPGEVKKEKKPTVNAAALDSESTNRKSCREPKPKHFMDYDVCPLRKREKKTSAINNAKLSPNESQINHVPMEMDVSVSSHEPVINKKNINTNKVDIKKERTNHESKRKENVMVPNDCDVTLKKIQDQKFTRPTRKKTKEPDIVIKGPSTDVLVTSAGTDTTSSSFNPGCIVEEAAHLAAFSNIPSFSLQQNLRLFKRQPHTNPSKVIIRRPLLHGCKNIIESEVEEEHFSSAFALMKENVSHFFHPTPKLWHTFMELLKEQKSKFFRRDDLYCTLQTLPLLHPVKEIPSVYILALQNPIEEELENIVPTMTMYDMVVETNIRDCIKMLEEEVRPRTFISHVLYTTHIVDLLEVNFNDVLADIKQRHPGGAETSLCKKETDGFGELRRTLVWQMFWMSTRQCTVNNNIKRFTSLMLNLVQTATCDKGYDLGQLLMTMYRLLLECVSLKDELTSSCKYGDSTSSLVNFAKEQCSEIIFNDRTTAPKTKIWFLSQLQPAWFKYRLLEFLFDKCNIDFVPEISRKFLKKKLSIEKIIHCYFFMHSHTKPSYDKHVKGNPLNDIKNVSQRSPSPKKNPLTRRNAKGETLLQLACIKNDKKRVEELLTLGADVNLTDHAGWSPLHEACIFGFDSIVDLLLENPNTDVCCTSSIDGTTPLHDAVAGNHLKIVEKLLRKGGSNLLRTRSKLNKSAVDLAKTLEMKQLLSCENIHREEEPRFISAAAAKPQLVKAKYQSLSPLPSKDVEYYLLLLNNLLKSYLTAEECRVNCNSLKEQYSLLQQHIEGISSKKSLKCKLYLNSIAKMLKISDCNFSGSSTV